MPTGSRPARRIVPMLLVGLLKSLAWALVLSVPLLAVWAASSLAAFADGPRRVVIAAGLLVFPILPLAWEGLAETRRRRRAAKGERILTFGDRMTLRTLAVGLALLVPMTLAFPERLFGALTTRGDWFLEGLEGDAAASARHAVLGAADGLVWVYDLAHENPYRDGEDGTSTPVPPAPMPDGDVVVVSDDGAAPAPVVPAPAPPPVAPIAAPVPPPPPPPRREWPFDGVVHPALATIPPTAESSPEALGQWIANRTTDELERARLAHDWIATHVAYDVPALTAPHRPAQDAETVMRTGLGVCEGYARLFDAVASAAGLESDYVVGDARTGLAPGDGGPHAWNAVRIDGTLGLLDVTWDAGSVSDAGFRASYGTAYFLTPADVFVTKHFPDDDRWQLLDPPIARGDFNRRPILSPEFFAAGFRLDSPTRSQVDTESEFHARVETDRTSFMLVDARPMSGGPQHRCETRSDGPGALDVSCALPWPGRYEITFFVGDQRYGTYWSAGSVEAIAH